MPTDPYRRQLNRYLYRKILRRAWGLDDYADRSITEYRDGKWYLKPISEEDNRLLGEEHDAD